MRFATVICLVLGATVKAQFHGPPSGYGPPDGVSGSGSGTAGFGPPDGSFSGSLDFDVNTATRYRTIHGILAAIAFAILFPIGAMSMRIIPGRSALWLHAITQVVAYIFFIAAAALGIWLVLEVRIPVAGGSLLNIRGINYHPIIGLIVLAALFFQPILGLIHHWQFKKLRRRQIWSHLHLWNGRVVIPLGIINGGLGLHVAEASRELTAAYAAVAGVLGGLWIIVAVMSEARRRRATKRTPSQVRRRASRREKRRERLAGHPTVRHDSQSS